MKKRIFPYRFPTTIYLVDDDLSYLKTLRANLEDNRVYEIFDSPSEAVDEIQKYSNPSFFKEKHMVISYLEEERANLKNIEINLYAIKGQIYDANRFRQPSIVIVDQEMPQMKGIELCRNLERVGVKKLMLTGEADAQFAVSAFNKGEIDSFVSKKEEDFFSLLEKNIEKLDLSYFNSQYPNLLDNLTHELSEFPIFCLKDSNFNDFFEDLCSRKEVIEYYLADDKGSFLLMDFEGNLTLLVVKDESEMEAVEGIVGSDTDVSDELLRGIKDKNQILYLHDKKDEALSSKEWEERGYFHPAKCLEGDNGKLYYYAILDKPEQYSGYDIKKDQIVSLRDFLESIET